MADYTLTKTGAQIDAIHTKVDGIEAGADVTDEANVSVTASVVANTAKVTNATHTGEVTGSGALTIASGVVDVDNLAASGTANTTTFLRGDDTWAVPPAGGSPEGTAVLSTGETGAVKFLREDGDGTCSWQTPAGSGDMTQAVYDPTAVSGDAFDMDNMVEGTTTKILTSTERSEIAANTLKNTYPSADATTVGHITVTQAVDLDTIESDTATNNAKVTNATHTGDVTGSGALTIANKTGADTGIVTGTAGTSGNLAEWNADGDAVDSSLATADVVTGSSTDTLTNKTIAAGSNTAKIFTESHATSHTLSAAECYGGVYYVTGAATLTLPAVAEGMHLTVITIGAVAVSVDPNASDKIVLDGTTLDDGDKITNTSTAGDIAVLTYYSADGWHASTNTWTDGGA